MTTKIDVILTKACREALEELQQHTATFSKSQMLRNQLLKFMLSTKDFVDFDLISGKEVTENDSSAYEIVEVKVDDNRIIEIIQPMCKTDTLPPKPKVLNSVLIRATLPPEMAEDVIANLEHFYETVWKHKHGSKTAFTIFYIQNARVVFGYYLGAVRSALELYLKLKK
jgi:hypothetical protein